MRGRFYPLSSSLLPIRVERGGLFQCSNISHTNCKQHISVPFSVSTDRVEEQSSEITVRRDTLARVCVTRFFEERLRDCSRDLFVPTLRLHPAVRRLSGATSAAVIFLGDRLRDCTAYIFMHRLCTATSNKHTRCIV
jgi:hypothetical protein